MRVCRRPAWTPTLAWHVNASLHIGNPPSETVKSVVGLSNVMGLVGLRIYLEL